MKIVSFLSGTVACIPAILYAAVAGSNDERGGGSAAPSPRIGLKATIVYDNRSSDERLEARWGFACIVEGLEKTILFDTGGDAATLLANLDSLGFSPRDVDAVVLSHAHLDHTGGLNGFLEANHDVAVYVFESCPSGVRDDARSRGAEVIEVRQPTELCAGALLTGEIVGESGIPEQCLLLRGDAGAAVITGCAHPGIVRIVERAKMLIHGEVLVVLGGFHLARDSGDSIRSIISRLRELGVRHAVPCHCSGDVAIELFADAFGAKFEHCSVGKVFDLGRMISRAEDDRQGGG